MPNVYEGSGTAGAADRVLRDGPTTGDFGLGRKAQLVVAYSGFAVTTIALVIGAAAITWPGRLAGAALCILSFAVAVRAKSGKGLGKLVVDESGITRRGWLGSKRIEWDDIAAATTGTLSARNLSRNAFAGRGSTGTAGPLVFALADSAMRLASEQPGGLGSDDWYLEIEGSDGRKLFIDGADILEYERARAVLHRALAARSIPLRDA